MNMNSNATARQTVSRVAITNAFLRSVYNWMAIGLGLTALAAFLSAQYIMPYLSPGLYIGLIVGELALVFILSARINSFSAGTATAMFLGYSVLNGVTLAVVLLAYTGASVAQAFLTTAGMFAAISLYGLTTKRDLATIGSYAMMALFGLIIAMVVNIFVGSSQLDLLICGAGILIFVGLTAYDTQFLKEMGESIPQNDSVAVHRGVILGALRLYLDFINLFLMLLRFMGDRR